MVQGMSALQAQGIHPKPLTEHHHIGALDALRGIAVLAVLAYHLEWPWLPGGFLGVDLFFVLSGFLITSVLLRIPRDQPIEAALKHFFERRFRRLLPALFLLLLTVAAWAAWIAIPEQLTHLRAQGIGTLFSVSNWVFIFEDISYAEAFNDPSVLQHTWSLAIEEQFYLLWPLIVIALVVRRAALMPLIIATTGVAAASAITMAILASGGDLNTAYLSTFSRIHEILIGALGALGLMFLTTRQRRRALRATQPTRWVPLMIIGAAGVMLAAMLFLSVQSLAYYQGGSVVFSLATIALIVLLVRYRPDGSALLRNRTLRWVGLISYGLYLWHWPIIVWLTPATTPWDGLVLDGVRIAVSFALATGSFYLLERPLRRGGWPRLPLSARTWWRGLPIAFGVVFIALVASTASAATLSSAESNESVRLPDHVLGAASNAVSTVMIVGDSVPKELMASLGTRAAERGITIIPMAFGGCSAIGLFQVDEQGNGYQWSRRCLDVVALQQDALTQYEPDMVIWYSNRERYGIRTDDGEIVAAGTAPHAQVITAAIQQTAQRLTHNGARLVIVEPTPKADAIIGSCSLDHTAAGCSQDPATVLSFEWLTQTYEQVATDTRGVRLVNVDDLLCPGGPPCAAAQRDSVVLRPDGVHLAEAAEEWFAGVLLDRVL